MNQGAVRRESFLQWFQVQQGMPGIRHFWLLYILRVSDSDTTNHILRHNWKGVVSGKASLGEKYKAVLWILNNYFQDGLCPEWFPPHDIRHGIHEDYGCPFWEYHV